MEVEEGFCVDEGEEVAEEIIVENEIESEISEEMMMK